jgi:hypothetical protein
MMIEYLQEIELDVELRDERGMVCSGAEGELEWLDSVTKRSQRAAVSHGTASVKFRLHKDKAATHRCLLKYNQLEHSIDVTRKTGALVAVSKC